MSDRSKRKKKLTLRERLTRRKTHRLAAHVSREDQWDYDVPNIRLSRAFVVVVVLHIVAVGGILIFEVLKPDGRGSMALSDDPNGAMGNDPRLNNAIPEGVKIGDPRTEGLEPYIVRSGDTLSTIAGNHGVSVDTLERTNRLDQGGRIYPGRHLFIPKDDAVPAEAEMGMVAAGGSSGGSSGAAPAVLASQHQAAVPAPRERVVPAPVARQPEVVSIPDVPAPRPVVTREPEPVQPPRYAVTESPAPQPVRAQPVRPVSGSGGGVHTMARGENPYAIARLYGVNVKQLLKVNGISDPTNIQIGQRLKIPTRR